MFLNEGGDDQPLARTIPSDSIRGEADNDRRPEPGCAFDRQRSAVQLRQLDGQGQSEAGTFESSRKAVFNLMKEFERIPDFRARHADPCVSNRQS